MAIIHNLVSGNASSTSQYGIQITTSTLVTELQNTSGTVQLDAAISQVGIGIGTRHPDFPIYTCIDISAQSAGPNEVQIYYTWEYRFPEIRYEISGNIISEQTNIDADGNVITSSYTYPASYTENPELAGEEFTTSILVDAYVPETVISITRQEYITGLALIEKSKIFTGTVNIGGWLGMGAYATHGYAREFQVLRRTMGLPIQSDTRLPTGGSGLQGPAGSLVSSEDGIRRLYLLTREPTNRQKMRPRKPTTSIQRQTLISWG